MKKYWPGFIFFVYFFSLSCLGIVITTFEEKYVQTILKETAILAPILFLGYYFLQKWFKLSLENIFFPIFLIICYFIVNLFIAEVKITHPTAQDQKPEIEKPIGRIARG